MIQPRMYVKVFFHNGTQAEGIVESWSNEESVLVSESGDSHFIIFHTNKDLIGAKIINAGQLEEAVPRTQPPPQKKFEETVEEFQKVYAQPSGDDLRIKNLAQLKSLMNEQEKKIISEKLKEHTISEVRLPQYGLPSFVSVPRLK